jgi:hypothetical protein
MPDKLPIKAGTTNTIVPLSMPVSESTVFQITLAASNTRHPRRKAFSAESFFERYAQATVKMRSAKERRNNANPATKTIKGILPRINMFAFNPEQEQGQHHEGDTCE